MRAVGVDSTTWLNLSIGPPLDTLCDRRDRVISDRPFQITTDDPNFARIRERYSTGIGKLFDWLLEPDWNI